MYKNPEDRKEYLRKYYSIEKNRNRARGSYKKYYYKNHEEILERKRAYKRTPEAREKYRKYGKWYRDTHPEFREKQKEKNRINGIIRRNKIKIEVMNHYGKNGGCVCCEEKIIQFLTIDHVNSDGGQHRKEKKHLTGEKMYKWLKDNNFPEGFEAMCWNCNSGRSVNGGICPHKQPTISDS